MVNWIILSSLLISAVTLLRFLFRKRLGPCVIYALWAVVLIRLLIPFNPIASRLSLLNLSVTDTSPPLHSPDADNTPPQNDLSSEYPDSDIDKDSKKESLASVKTAFTAIWAVGSAVTAAVFIVSNVKFLRELRKTRIPHALNGYPLPLYLSPAVGTPCLFGLFLPTVYILPHNANDTETLSHILTHELVHYRHGDHIWSALRCLCLVIHWFNPLVWMAADLSLTDSELACDEGTVRLLGEDHRLEYGRTLVSIAQGSVAPPLLSSVTLNSAKTNLRLRINNLAAKTKNNLFALAFVLLALTFFAGCTMTGPRPSVSEFPPELNRTEETTCKTEDITKPPEAALSTDSQPSAENPHHGITEIAKTLIESEDFEQVVDPLYHSIQSAVTTDECVQVDVIDFGIKSISKNEDKALCWVLFYVLPQEADKHRMGYLEGPGFGEYEGWVRAYADVLIQKNTQGQWSFVYATPMYPSINHPLI